MELFQKSYPGTAGGISGQIAERRFGNAAVFSRIAK